MTLDQAMVSFAHTIKEQIHKWDSIKIKNFCAFKNPIKTVKENPQNGNKIFANISDMGLISRICKECLQFNNKKDYPIKSE